MLQPASQGVPNLELRDGSKAFGQVIALGWGSLTLCPGSVHALVGENRAAKSTLGQVMAGAYQLDSGTPDGGSAGGLKERHASPRAPQRSTRSVRLSWK
jgi:ABC-type sugar transport system ATPase subunit